MRIGVLSDTHSTIDEKICSHLKECDEIWHAGDIGDEKVIGKLKEIAKVRAVFGNIDNNPIRLLFPNDLFFKCEGMEVFMTHIAGYPGNYNKRAKEIIRIRKPGIVVCGHSHILRVIYDKELEHLHINPGAAGKSGFHQLRTLVRFRLDGGKISGMEIVEMKR